MKNNSAQPATIDEYIAAYPEPVQKRLKAVRAVIRKAAPAAEEAISYRIPTYKLHGNLVHFAAFKHHIGFYPTASGVANFKKDLSQFKSAKGSVQFPLDTPLPLNLIGRIVKFRVRENLARAEGKLKRR